MGREKHLTKEEKKRIDEFHQRGFSCRMIAKMLLRSVYAVTNYIRNQNIPKIEHRGGARRGESLNQYETRAVLRSLSNSSKSCSKLKTELNIAASVETIRATIHRCSDFDFKRKSRVQYMTIEHMQNRVDWSVHYGQWGADWWHQVIFSDEKKWSLDGPDGLAFYWHDPRKPEVTFKKRQGGGGTIMVWGCFSIHGTSELYLIDGNATAQDYLYILESNFLPYIDRLYRDRMIFQQDNAAIHTAGVVREWFEEEQITTLPWPAKSPDLNPIENIWGILSRVVYEENKQYNTKAELWTAVQRAWASISHQTIENLINSMPNRCIEVIQAEGQAIKY